MSSTRANQTIKTNNISIDSMHEAMYYSTPDIRKPTKLRKLTLWSECNLFLLHLFYANVYWILKPLMRLDVPVGATLLSSMFGLMIFIPPFMCWIILTSMDIVIPGVYKVVMDLKKWWIPCTLLWYMHTLWVDRAPRTVVGAKHRPPRNAIDDAAHKLYFWNCIEYFPIQVVPWAEDATLPPDRPYIFALHPHGIFCWSLFMFAAKGTPFDKRFPGLCGEKLVGLIATVLFILPVLRDFFLEWPYIDARRQVAQDALAAGLSLYLIPGGEEESVQTTWGEDTVVLSHRKGFIRLALSHGADIVPVFGAGTTETFVTYPTTLLRFRQWLQKRLGVAVAPYRGQYFTPLPFRNTPQRILIGKPIPTPKPTVKGSRPEEKLVEEYHQKYVAALKELHDKHVLDKPLIIL